MSGHKISGKALSSIYAKAAVWLERNPVESADVAIRQVTKRLSPVTISGACILFRDSFGCWIGNGEGILMLCFASAMAATGELS